MTGRSTHGHTRGRKTTPEFRTWCAMKQRCFDPNHVKFKDYGARGISVSGEWLGPDGFEKFLAEVGEKPSPLHSIDRVDNEGNYEPGNCKWSTPREQAANRRAFKTANALKTHCPAGHSYSGENLLETKTGRKCRRCSRSQPLWRRLNSLTSAEESLAGEVALYDVTCSDYRYILTRGRGTPELGVVMLNSSTATAFKDDPTIRRVRKFAASWGYGRVTIGNAFAYRSPHPSDLLAIKDPPGPLNDLALRALVARADSVLVAWGAFPLVGARAALVQRYAAEFDTPLICLGMTSSGAPIHPLARGKMRVPDDTTPRVWPRVQCARCRPDFCQCEIKTLGRGQR